jgi:hypothetical protein
LSRNQSMTFCTQKDSYDDVTGFAVCRQRPKKCSRVAVRTLISMLGILLVSVCDGAM